MNSHDLFTNSNLKIKNKFLFNLIILLKIKLIRNSILRRGNYKLKLIYGFYVRICEQSLTLLILTKAKRRLKSFV